MVKNTSGGSKHKSSARKHAPNDSLIASRDPTPSSPFEKIATVDRLLGNGMCLVLTHEPTPLSLICHIRGKFRGKRKSQNIVSNKSTVLIGLREWEPTPKNCDLLAIFNHNTQTLTQNVDLDISTITQQQQLQQDTLLIDFNDI